MDNSIEQLSRVVPSERILLLPHCLRRSKTCSARYDSSGLQCARCNPDCPVNKLVTAGLEYGYKGICVAPGGRLAINFVKEKRPRAIVAVACARELEEGIQGVEKLASENIVPVIAIIPLEKDGCIDTEVDAAKALEIIAAGCVPAAV